MEVRLESSAQQSSSFLRTSNRFQYLVDEMDQGDDVNIEPEVQQGIYETTASTTTKEKDTENIDASHMLVNTACIQPAQLMVLPIKIGEQNIEGLVDSGATKSLIRQNIVESLNLSIANNNQPLTVKGLGDSFISSIGSVEIDINLFGIILSVCAIVVPDESISYDVVLGTTFLKSENLYINMSLRKIGKIYPDNSKIDFYLDTENKLINIIHVNVPVYAQSDVKLTRSGVPVPVQGNFIPVNIAGSSDVLFEGKTTRDTNAVDGILNLKQDVFSVILCTDAHDHKTVRKGEKLGLVSTLVDLEEDDVPDENTRETWNREILEQKIKLDDSLDSSQSNIVYDMLLTTQDAMSSGDDDIGRARVMPHSIELTNDTPIWQRPRRFSEPVNKEIDRQCKELLSLDIIEYSDSDWSAAVVPVRKKDGSLRMCVDYRMLNKVTKQESFPMPNISESIYKAHNVQFFTKLDLVRGYYQVPIHENSRKFTAFSTPHSHYHFKRLSFGLRNSGIAFQKCMQQILSEFCFHNVLVYIDDILIMTETFNEHVTLVEKVLTTLLNNGIKIKVDKCQFFRKEVEFLGHLVSNNGIKKSTEFIRKISEYPKPKNVTQLRQFLGLANFQRKFVDQCSVISKPLTEQTSGAKKRELVWTDDMNNAYDSLKRLLVEDVTLSYPDYSATANKLELFVDASSVGSGACLMQNQGGVYKTIAYSSMSFSQTQRRYSTIERELVALRWGIKTFRAFLFAVPFVIYTDHKPLLYLHNMARENSRLMRTLNELAEFDFTIRYKPGRDNCAADAMSRIVNVPCDEDVEPNDELPSGFILLRSLEGGGDTMIQSVYICLAEISDEICGDLPDSVNDLRCTLVDFLSDNPRRFNVKPGKDFSKRMKLMRLPGQLPCEELLLVACHIFNVQIHVHHGGQWPVIYATHSTSCPIIHLQCKSGIHFNPAFDKKQNVRPVNPKCINYVHEFVHDVSEANLDTVCGIDGEDDVELVACNSLELCCNHVSFLPAGCFVNTSGVKFCALVDTGAQVSLLREGVFEQLKQQCGGLNRSDLSGKFIAGIDGSKTEALGYVILSINFDENTSRCPMPFVIVADNVMPCCAILGANFLIANQITLNFKEFSMSMPSPSGETDVFVNLQGANFVESSDNHVALCMSELSMSDASDSSSTDSDSDAGHNFSFLSRSQTIDLQNDDDAICLLKQNLVESVEVKFWREENIQPFKHYFRFFRVQSDLLLYDKYEKSIPVVPFSFAVDFIWKTHCQLAHIGKHKLVALVRKQIFHPSITKIIADLCQSCSHCQLYKVSSQLISPPVIKIKSRYPFDLIAMDLLMFERSSAGNMVALVIVDHFSKFVMIVPLKDKKSASVCRALNTQIFPSMIRLPSRVLTDNGPEFISKEFEDSLKAYNIAHVNSTRYRAQGNGAVERVNRTIIEFLKGTVQENPKDWDVAMAKAVIIYNNTWHAVIRETPVNCILAKSHNIDDTVPIDAAVVDTWKEAHPNFHSFAVGQRVAMKINRIGNQLKWKLDRKFTGPWTVSKIQSNGVSYEVSDGDKTVKAHHRQLKPWFDLPDYLANSLQSCSEESVHATQCLNNSMSVDSDDEICDLLPNFVSEDSGSSGSESSCLSDSDNSCVPNVNLKSVEFQDVSGKSDADWITADMRNELCNLKIRFEWYEIFLDTETILEESILSFSSDDNDIDNCANFKISSPMFSMDRNIIDVSPDVSPIDKASQTVIPTGNDIGNSFLLWLEQSLNLQEDFIDKVVTVSSSLNNAWLQDVGDLISLESCEDLPNDNDGLDVIKSMRSHLSHVVSGVADYRANRSDTHRIRLVPESDSNDCSLMEVSDIVPEINLEVSSTYRRMTRSLGAAQEYPNVMTKPVEYKSANKK